jgi:aconitate decarboxylase
MTIGLTRALAAYIAQGPKAGIELQQAQDIACMGMMDAIAVAMAAGTEMVTRVALERARSASNAQDDGAPIWFSGEIMPTPQAAFVNGVASHALDYDDVALSGHPSTALTPAIMAMAHALQASGEDCLRAYVVGYEVWAELVGREPDPYHIKGWHPTAVFGTVAATAALAYLRRFNEEQVTRALAISASLASGVVANFGTMTKPLHSGRVAALAFEALELASLGLTAAYDALEHHAGFLAALSPHGNVDRDRPYVCGAPHILSTGLSIKKYPVCYSGHRVIDAVIDMANKENIDAANIDRIIVGMGPAQASMLRSGIGPSQGRASRTE